jgi:hypothetical protein
MLLEIEPKSINCMGFGRRRLELSQVSQVATVEDAGHADREGHNRNVDPRYRADRMSGFGASRCG